MRELESKTGNKITLIEADSELRHFDEWMADHPTFGLDFETTSTRPHEAQLVGIGVGGLDKTGVYIPVGHRVERFEEIEKQTTRNGLTHSPKTGKRYTRKATVQIPWADSETLPGQTDGPAALRILGKYLADPKRRVVAHNWKYELALIVRWFRESGILLALDCQQDCTLLQDWLLRTERFFPHDLKSATKREFGASMVEFEEVATEGKERRIKKADLQIGFAPIDSTATYCGDDAIFCVGLDDRYKPRLQRDGLLADYERIEMPMVNILVDMESRGVRIDTAKLLKVDDRLRVEMQERHEQMAGLLDLAPDDLPITSPKGLSTLLFEERKWEPAPGTERSDKTGLYSTDKAMMGFFAEHPEHGLPEQHEFSKLKMRHSQIKKLLENYTLKIVNEVNEDGRIRSQTKQAGTVSGRFSMADPSLHNIPSRTEDGKLIRMAFVASEGCQLVVRDYSQIEPRLTGFFADCPVLREIYTTGQDIYLFLADMLKRKTGVEVERGWAKALVLGLNYGMGYRKLARDLGISEFLAKRIYQEFFEILREVVRWKEAVVRAARKTEFIKTITGRRRYIPEINTPLPFRSQFQDAKEFEDAEDRARIKRALGEREAVNTTVQGSAGDILKIAMRNTVNRLKEERLDDRAWILLTVHDEIIMETKNEVADTVSVLLQEEMEGAVDLGGFPLVAEGGIVSCWGDAK